MTNPRSLAVLFCALSVGCPTTPAPADPASTAPVVAEPSKPPWWPLTVMPQFEFERPTLEPPQLDPSRGPAPPARLVFPTPELEFPPNAHRVYSGGPTRWLAIDEGSCAVEWPVAEACAEIEENAAGEHLVHGRREGRQITRHEFKSGIVRSIVRCTFSDTGHEIESLRANRRTDSCSWSFSHTRRGFDEEGIPYFEHTWGGDGRLRADGVDRLHFYDVHANYAIHEYDEKGRLEATTNWSYGMDSGPYYIGSYRYAWNQEDQLTRFDYFTNESQPWNESRFQSWHGDYVQVVLVERGSKTDIWRRLDLYRVLGPNRYELVYERGPEGSDLPIRRWEATTKDNVETVTEYKDDVVVGRRRYELVDESGHPTRRPLTVEQLVPDVTGLAVVERWRYEPDRVVVERTGGRTTYLFECSGLPAMESDFEVDCRPPSRGTPTQEEVGVMLEWLAERRARDEAEKPKYLDEDE